MHFPPSLPSTLPRPVKMLPSSSRRSGDNSVFGFPSHLPTNSLPTHSDVLKRLLLSKGEVTDLANSTIPVSTYAKPVAQEVIEKWSKASIPTMTFPAVMKKITQAYEQGRSCERLSKTYENKEKLFDICACQCPQVACDKVDCVGENCDEIHIKHANGFVSDVPLMLTKKNSPFLWIRDRKERCSLEESIKRTH